MSHNSISRREIILLGLVLAVAVISGFFYKNKESPPSVIEKVQKNEVVQTTLDDCRQDIPLDKIDDSAVDTIRHSIRKGTPYGSLKWVEEMVKEYKMESTVRAPGRPIKG